MDPRRPEVGRSGRRGICQWIGLGLFNSYYLSPVGKFLCIPVLNCYSCPVGVTACPIGTLSAFALARKIPFYLLGFLGLCAVAVGRAFCGWACPFGLLQDLLYRIPGPKWKLPRVADALKYVLLVVLVLALPFILGGGKMSGASDRVTGEATGAVDYCSTVCPAGTAEASIPYLIKDPQVRAAASWRTYGKIAALVAILGLVVVARRGFCRALCPLGALMALGSGLSLLRLRTDRDKCTRCMRCVKVCPMNCRRVPQGDAAKEATSECVLCLDCVRNCPESGALSAQFAGRCVSAAKGSPVPTPRVEA